MLLEEKSEEREQRARGRVRVFFWRGFLELRLPERYYERERFWLLGGES